MTATAFGRTLLFAFYTAHPPTGGASAVTYQLACHWPGERKLVQIGDDPGMREATSGLQVVTLAYRGRGERWQKLIEVPRWIHEMTSIAADYRPDTIILEGASWCAYHWLLMSALRRRLPSVKLIYHAHNVEYDLRRQKHNRLVAELTRWFEGRVLAGVDIATSVSPVDASRFQVLYGRETVLLPNGVDVAWLQSATPASIEALRARYQLTAETVLFMGAYAYKPNGEAIDFLVKEVFPALMSLRPEARLLILGGEVPYERPWLIAPGLVPSEELPSFIHAAAVSVAPIFSGSGTRLKILELLAAGTPAISTAKGMEGLPLEPGVDILLAETAHAFVDLLNGVLADPAKARQWCANSMVKVVSGFSWLCIIQTFSIKLISCQN